MTIKAKSEDGVNEGTIVEVQVPSYADRLRAKSRPVGDCAFFGIWKDRTDIGDTVEYIRGLRRGFETRAFSKLT